MPRERSLAPAAEVSRKELVILSGRSGKILQKPAVLGKADSGCHTIKRASSAVVLVMGHSGLWQFMQDVCTGLCFLGGRGRRKIAFTEYTEIHEQTQGRASWWRQGPGFCASCPTSAGAYRYFVSSHYKESLPCIYYGTQRRAASPQSASWPLVTISYSAVRVSRGAAYQTTRAVPRAARHWDWPPCLVTEGDVRWHIKRKEGACALSLSLILSLISR